METKIVERDTVVTQNKRYEYIDFLRGIAAINIVFIHTAFWAGAKYIPPQFYNMTLLIDVPFFFYISGWTTNYYEISVDKSFRSLFKIWMKWIFFATVLFIVCRFAGIFFEAYSQYPSNLKDIVETYMFNMDIKHLPVIKSSTWFLQWYFIIVLFNAAIMQLIARINAENKRVSYKIYMYILISAVVWCCFEKYIFGISIYFLFYSMFYMMGVCRIGGVQSTKCLAAVVILLISGMVIFSIIQELPIYDIQSAKFPPTIKYGFFSMISIVIAKYFESRHGKLNSFVIHIGENALYYYFSQGIGSSLNYYVVNALQIEPWPYKLALTFLSTL